jgi:hypothetical protein
MSDLISEYTAYTNGSRKMYHGANVIFREDAVEDIVASEKEGRPIFRTIDVIEIRYPGEGPNVLEVTDKHKREYAEQWAAYQNGKEAPISGTPLEQWAPLSKAYCEEFKRIGLRTVEQLAEANDNVKKKLKGNFTYIKKAQEWLANASSSQNQVTALQKENEKLNAKLETMENQIAALLQRIDLNEGTDHSSPLRQKPKKERAISDT